MIIFSTTLSLFLFLSLFFFFFFNDPPTTEIYTLSLHDALPIFRRPVDLQHRHRPIGMAGIEPAVSARHRSEEHTSELQSRQYLVCRLLLEKKKKKKYNLYKTMKKNE